MTKYTTTEPLLVAEAAMEDAYYKLNDLMLHADKPNEKLYSDIKKSILGIQDVIGKKALKKPKVERYQQAKKLIDNLINTVYPEAHSTEPKIPLQQLNQQVYRIWSWFTETRVMDMGKEWTREDTPPEGLPATASTAPRKILYRNATYVRVD